MLYWLWRVRVRQSARALVARLRPAVTAQS
jgi:hypothetical protein